MCQKGAPACWWWKCKLVPLLQGTESRCLKKLWLQQSYYWEYSWRRWNQDAEETPALSRLLQRYSQYPGNGNNSVGHQLKQGWGRCRPHTWWDTIWPQKAWNLVTCDNMDGTGDHYVKWKKPGVERWVLTLSLICGRGKVYPIVVESRMVVTRGWGRQGRGRDREKLISRH